MSIKLDYTIDSPQERCDVVKEMLLSLPQELLTVSNLDLMSDYIISASLTKYEKKKKCILTDNRLATVNKRETSYQGLVEKLEAGEDGVYNMMASDKNILLTPKISITEKDLEEIPGLRELRNEIEKTEKRLKTATGKDKYILKKQIIQMRQDQYVLKNAFKPPVVMINVTKSFATLPFEDKIEYNEQTGKFVNKGLISFFDYKHISALLTHYSALKEEAWGEFKADGFYMMEDLDILIDEALKDDYPIYYDIVIYKIDGLSNTEIRERLLKKHNVNYTFEYISTLWKNKIPKVIAEKAYEKYLVWYHTYKVKGKWKKCSRCGQIKLAHNYFFSRNSSSKDGFYSICKKCKNATAKEKRKVKKEKELKVCKVKLKS